MLDIKLIEKENAEVSRKLSRRGKAIDLSFLLELIMEIKEINKNIQINQEKRNTESKLLRNSLIDEISKKRILLKKINQKIKNIKIKRDELHEKILKLLLLLPNIPFDDVPDDDLSVKNHEIKKIGNIKTFNFKIKDHVELGELIGGLNFERAAKISGSRFAFLEGSLAKLNRALLQYFLNFHVDFGDKEIAPPFIVSENSMIGTGQLPKFRDEVFEINHRGKPYFLIPTAEVPVTNYYSNEILNYDELPIRLCAYSPCFRSEAGAAGRDTRGLIRQHQFEKVEMVRFAEKKSAIKELDLMVDRVTEILNELNLPHRVICLSARDLGFSAEKTIDIEVWVPSQNKYIEISSCSMFGDFQARRANIRYKKKISNKKNQIEFVSTLNGSGLPIGRTLIAILENHQNEDGSINIPKVLWPFMSGLRKLNK